MFINISLSLLGYSCAKGSWKRNGMMLHNGDGTELGKDRSVSFLVFVSGSLKSGKGRAPPGRVVAAHFVVE